MAVKNLGEKYVCGICGNQVLVIKVGGGELVCCGEDMELMRKMPAKEEDDIPAEEEETEEEYEEIEADAEDSKDF